MAERQDTASQTPGLPAGGRGHGGRDLTTGPIMRTLLLFALPTLGSNVLQSLNESINAIWVGNILGEAALAATSNANLVMFLMLAAVFGFGLAATILVGQNIGRRDVDAARRAMGTAVGVFAIASFVLAAVGWVASPAILRVLATPGPALPLAETYLKVLFAAMPGALLLVIITMGLRGTGDSMTPFFVMILNVALDSGLNPVFIKGWGPIPAMGIGGAAFSTLLANYTAVIVLIVTIYARDLTIRLRGAELRYLIPDPALLRVVIAKGFPIALQMFVVSGSALTLIGLVNRAGVDTTAAYGVAQQLWTYIQMPAMAIGAAVSAMVAQNIGAGKWERVDAVTRSGIVANILMTGALVLLLTLVDRTVLAWFLGTHSPALPIARHIHAVASWSFIVFGVTMVIFGTVRANGAVVAPLVILAIALFPVRLGFAFALLPRMGVDAIWWTMPLGSIATVVMATVYYRRGSWRKLHLMAATADEEMTKEAAADCDPTGKRRPAA